MSRPLDGAHATARQFGLFRMLLGAFVAIQMVRSIPYGPELFGDRGFYPDPFHNGVGISFLSFFSYLSGPLSVRLALAFMALLALGLAAGYKRRPAALLLWYGMFSMAARNPLSSHPGMEYLSWLVAACCLVPEGEAYRFGRKEDPHWRMPDLLFYGATFILAASYSVSGLDKLRTSPSWLNGNALALIFERLVFDDSLFIRGLKSLPPEALRALTRFTLLAECLCLPLCLSSKSRFLAWTLMLGMNIVILLTIRVADLTLAIALFHLFVFDHRWLELINPGERARRAARA